MLIVKWLQWLSLNNQSKATCTRWLRAACVPSAPLGKLPLMHPFSVTKKGAFSKLPSVTQDLASFLLTRGPFAWMGHEWGGCNTGTPLLRCSCIAAQRADDARSVADFYYPPILNEDFGVPLTDDCRERGSSAAFERQWSNAKVSVDCTTLSGRIDMADGRVLTSLQSPLLPTLTKRGGYGGRGLAVPVGSEISQD